MSSGLFKALARYRQAEQFSHFSSQLSKETRIDLTVGKYLLQALQQPPEERHSLIEQQLIMETILGSGGELEIDVPGMKNAIKEEAKKIKDLKDDEMFEKIEKELLKKYSATPLAAKPAAAPGVPTPAEVEKKPEEAKK
jgi:F0F1-type ATP synthase alpha subunit